MPRSRSPYPPEYRAKVVALAHAGRTVQQLAAEFEASHQTIRNWIAQAAANHGARPGALTSAERTELTRLRRENRRLQLERDILGKAPRLLHDLRDIGERDGAESALGRGHDVHPDVSRRPPRTQAVVDGLAWRRVR